MITSIAIGGCFALSMNRSTIIHAKYLLTRAKKRIVREATMRLKRPVIINSISIESKNTAAAFRPHAAAVIIDDK